MNFTSQDYSVTITEHDKEFLNVKSTSSTFCSEEDAKAVFLNLFAALSLQSVQDPDMLFTRIAFAKNHYTGKRTDSIVIDEKAFSPVKAKSASTNH